MSSNAAQAIQFDPQKEQEVFFACLAELDGPAEGTAEAPAETSPAPQPTARPNPPPFPGTLKQGSTDTKNVKTIQNKLQALGYDTPTSGVFGSSTDLAVTKFQIDQDLPVTGKVDKQTWDVLHKQGTGAQVGQTITDIFTGISAGLPGVAEALGPQEPTPPLTAKPKEPEEEGPNWLLIGGVVVGSVVLIGGLAWLASR